MELRGNLKRSCDSLPFFRFVLACDFDESMCGFVQDKNDKFDWTRRKGSTWSPATGPVADHTGHGGFYNIYYLNSLPFQSQSSTYLSRCTSQIDSSWLQ